MIHTAIKWATVGGLLGLAVLHADSFAKIASSGVGIFRAGTRLA